MGVLEFVEFLAAVVVVIVVTFWADWPGGFIVAGEYPLALKAATIPSE